MKAVICTKYGSPEVLKLMDVKKPVPKDDEILIKVHATTVTSGDVRIRGFIVPASFWIPARLALGLRSPKINILGAELSGVVEAVGSDVTKFNVGDEVFAYPGHHGGGDAEYTTMKEDSAVAIKPKNLTFEEAAAVAFGGNTALHFLKQANIKEGDRILIYGASGSVGTYAVQLAKYFKAEVTGVCSTANTELVRNLGADHVIDYIKEDFTKNGEDYDVIFDAVGKIPVADTVKSLKKGGTYLQVVSTPSVSLKMYWISMRTGQKLIGGTAVPDTKNLEFLRELVENGNIRPQIDRIYSLDEIVEAHRYVEDGHKKGNVVVVV